MRWIASAERDRRVGLEAEGEDRAGALKSKEREKKKLCFFCFFFFKRDRPAEMRRNGLSTDEGYGREGGAGRGVDVGAK